jgi:ATP-dependent RNA helicase DDX1
VQAEAVPLILGGGDVMAAAETGSGKTAAFALPVLQVVHEALEARRRGGGGDGAAAPSAGPGGAPPAPAGCRLNAEDRDDVVAVSPDGLTCQARSESGWGGVRATLGARAGKAYFEATVSDEGLCRVGWAGRTSSLDIGTDKASFGYGGTGKKSHARRFEAYGEAYGLHDTLGCCLDADAGEVSFTKNGRPLGPAFAVPKALRGQPLFPAATLKNAQLEMNFGGAAFRHPPPPGFVGLAASPPEATARWQPPAPTSAADPLAARSPLAIILEPTHELAEQTHANVALFARHLGVRAALLTGGAPAAAQKAALREVPDIVVGTPGRVVQLIETGKLPVDAVQFFVLDEAGGLGPRRGGPLVHPRG